MEANGFEPKPLDAVVTFRDQVLLHEAATEPSPPFGFAPVSSGKVLRQALA